jgi:hypothetical protein
MCRLNLFILLIVVYANSIKAQQITYGYIDSLSYAQYNLGEWDKLLQTAIIAKKVNISFPFLNMRCGYAALMKGNHSLSLKHYSQAIAHNSFNQDALYYIALNNNLLGRRDAASFISKNLNNESKKTLAINHKKLIEVIDIETSVKPTNTEVRKPGQYYRLAVTNRLNYRWKIYNSLITYRQIFIANDTIYAGAGNRRPQVTFRNFLVHDYQYYVKSEVFLNQKISLINAFNYTHTIFDNNTFSSSIFNCGVKLSQPYADYKLEINVGPLLDSLLTQVAFSSTYYPYGNLNFYGNTRVSYQKRTNLSQFNYSQMLGFKLRKKVWLETQVVLGQIKNLIDNEALYIYDALDAGNYRIGASLLFPVTPKFTLLTNYYFEQKQLYLQNTNYNLHSFTLGISWKL